MNNKNYRIHYNTCNEHEEIIDYEGLLVKYYKMAGTSDKMAGTSDKMAGTSDKMAGTSDD